MSDKSDLEGLSEDLLKASEFIEPIAKVLKDCGLDATFVGHAMFCEALMLMLGCDRKRAHAMASGFLTLAVVDQRRYLDGIRSDVIDAAIKQELIGEKGLEVRAEFHKAKTMLRGSTSVPGYIFQEMLALRPLTAIER